MNVAFQNIPATEGVRKITRGEGERFDVAGAHLTWKVKAEDSGYAFSVCEQTLAPGEGGRRSTNRRVYRSRGQMVRRIRCPGHVEPLQKQRTR